MQYPAVPRLFLPATARGQLDAAPVSQSQLFCWNKWETAQGTQNPFPSERNQSDTIPVPTPAKGAINPCKSMCIWGESCWQR